jgi:hypothetical protein
MDARIRVDIDADAVIKKLHSDRFVREPLRVALNKIGRMGETDSKRRAPVDFGRLRASITHRVDDQPMMLSVDIGVIGSSGELPHAKYMEYGTGLTHDHPNWPRRVHVVPVGALSNWGPVRRNLVSAGAVATSITRRGGLKPRRYLRGMLEDNSSKFIAIIRRAVREMEL